MAERLDGAQSLTLRGSSPVVGSSRSITGGRPMRTGAEVEPAAHAAGVGRDAAVGRVDQPEAVEHLAARDAPRAALSR